MISTDLFRTKFAAAVPYESYIATGTPTQREDWAKFHAQVRPTEPQRQLLGSFTRRIHILTLSGIWCGDCVQQLPMLDHIARAAGGAVEPRFLDRDEHLDLAEQVRLCGGLRVPVVIFANEDFEFLALAGDRTLSRYRALAAARLGSACPLPGAPVPPDQIAATLQDWVDEVERVHLMLRLSPKLRARHGD